MWRALAYLAAVLPSAAGAGTVEDRAALTAALQPYLQFRSVLLPAYECRQKSQNLTTAWMEEMVRYRKLLSAAWLQTASPLVECCEGSSSAPSKRARPVLPADRTTNPVLAVMPSKVAVRDFMAQVSESTAVLHHSRRGTLKPGRGCISHHHSRVPDDLQRKCLLENGRTAFWNVLVWLVFFDAEDDIDDVFMGKTIDMDCKVLVAQEMVSEVRLLEVYRTSSRRPLQKVQLGTWRAGQLSWTAAGRFSRSSDLQGMVWNCSTARSWPLTVPSVKDGRLVINGYIPAVWRELERQLNFSTRCALWEADGPFDFERMMLIEGIDVGLRDIIPFSNTLDSVSITHPVCSVTIGMVMGRPQWQPLSWLSYLQPFSWSLWIALVTTAAVVILCLLLLHFADWHNTHPLADAVFAVISATLQQAPPSGRPLRSWQRLLLVSVHLTVTAVAAGYSAALVSFLASRDGWPPGRDFQHMVHHREFKLQVVSGSKEGIFVMDSMHPQLAELRRGSLSDAAPGPGPVPSPYASPGPRRGGMHLSLASALEAACRWPDQAVVTRLELVPAEPAPRCRLVAIPGLSARLPVVLPLRRRSPYARLLSYKITAMRESGVLSRMLRQQPGAGLGAGVGLGLGPPGVSRLTPVTAAHGFESVALRNAAPLFAGYALAALLSVCLLVAERLWAPAGARWRRLRVLRGRSHCQLHHHQFRL